MQRVRRPPGPQATGNRHRSTGTAPEQRLITASARQPAGAAADPLLLARPKTIHKRLFRESLAALREGLPHESHFCGSSAHRVPYEVLKYRGTGTAKRPSSRGRGRRTPRYITNTSYYG